MFGVQKIKVMTFLFSLVGLFLYSSQIAGASTKCSLLTGKAYRVLGEKTVYLVTKQCTKQAFADSTAFFDVFNSWKDVKKTSKKILNKIPDDKYYLIIKKRPIIVAPAPIAVVPNPISIKANLNILSCDKKQYTMAFVLVAKQGEATGARIKKLTVIKDSFGKSFKDATYGLAQMNTSDPVRVFTIDDSLIDYTNNTFDQSAVLKQFYERYSDKYDFISFYSTFEKPGAQIHLIVQQKVEGIGSNESKYNDSNIKQFNAGQQLLGLNLMENIDMYQDRDVTSSIRGLLHETGHQWCCYAGDDFNQGKNNPRLEIIQQGVHFYRGLAALDKGGDPMDSDYWVEQKPGIFSRENDANLTGKYHPFQLYFMGLLSPEEFDKQYAVYNTGIVGKNFDPANATFYKTVSVNDIIKVMGERKCAK